MYFKKKNIPGCSDPAKLTNMKVLLNRGDFKEILLPKNVGNQLGIICLHAWNRGGENHRKKVERKTKLYFYNTDNSISLQG